MAKAASKLEHLSYTGRVCHGFFDVLAKHSNPRTSRLKTIDLTVKNCCRHNAQWNESGSGITDMHFIAAFEQLVLGGIRALERLKSAELLRIHHRENGIRGLKRYYARVHSPLEIRYKPRMCLRRSVFDHIARTVEPKARGLRYIQRRRVR